MPPPPQAIYDDFKLQKSTLVSCFIKKYLGALRVNPLTVGAAYIRVFIFY